MDDPPRKLPADRSGTPPPSDRPGAAPPGEPTEASPAPSFRVVGSMDGLVWELTAPTPDAGDPPSDAE